ncbi:MULTISPECIES: ferredoxin reductase family protein [Pseudomonas]|uniref:ferredoxin reductase family protein n=1 Tax=Pseudomonas TaxID=286 RepID=UPI0007B37FBC|nr:MULTISPECIES: ferredoxin reductase family protein [Pseudomonas]AZC50587.1 Oxidoreductase, FAD-binding [Pseudomonas chlororaphis subsp. piscium]AZC57165.1 Oxidoreductase, FAD-binding [Pseudomonas chlororaphis subsp. piscium]AZC63379.1 Oxidoreductase, FAD-binding [Pseudomonas chlororaphis subsp. piscium]AZC69618.1 Oxidoreductase, FAD-binding [Pseudomonas chlororaphis subsp. piscium]AZC75797.1 Oxidoreductase, FAD-binding [Pseudomonas chlororaphis subsp. piscium]
MKTWYSVVGVLLITTFTLLLEIPSDTWLTSATLSLVLGATALAYMALSCLLASRWRWVERLFGGLDRVYESHKWLGIWALVFASYHLVFKANLDLWQSVPIIELSKYWTRMVRQLSYLALGLIVLLALNRNIPYGQWRWWHKLSGPLFAIVILHWLSFKSPIALDTPSGIWLTALCGLGLLGALYKLLLYPLLAKAGEYRVSAVTLEKNSLHLELTPLHRGFAFKAGQFAFLAMREKGLREPHPFTIASAHASDGRIEFVIRALGDYTQKLRQQVKVGMLADLYAPYGRFKRRLDAGREVWIGGGVGISPFISWLQDAAAGRFDQATLVYCCNPSRAFPSLETLQGLAEERGVDFIGHTDGADRLGETLKRLASETDPQQIQISFCGPKGLLARVKALMREHAIPERNLHYEFFEFR